MSICLPIRPEFRRPSSGDSPALREFVGAADRPHRQLLTGRLVMLTVLCSFPLLAHATNAQEPNSQPLQNADESEPVAAEAVTFSGMPADQVRSELWQWLASAGVEQSVLDGLATRWDETDPTNLTAEELLDQTVMFFAEADTATKRLLQESYHSGPLEGVIFDGIRAAPFYRNQVSQFRARWLVQHRFYDEALPLLMELPLDDVVDPAGLLFYRAICQSELLQRRDALDSLALLLNSTLDVPQRFRVVSEMMQKNLSEQSDTGMEQVGHLMKDVERRLDLGRSGEKTQEQEDAVIAALDKLLEELDQQNQQQQGGGGGDGGQQNKSGTQGASQSQIKGAPAEGVADRKELKEEGKWGMLDQKAEAQAREMIRQKFPPNFLDQIGRYTKKLAEQQK